MFSANRCVLLFDHTRPQYGCTVCINTQRQARLQCVTRGTDTVWLCSMYKTYTIFTAVNLSMVGCLLLCTVHFSCKMYPRLILAMQCCNHS